MASITPNNHFRILGKIADPELVRVLFIRHHVKLGDEGSNLLVRQPIMVRVDREVPATHSSHGCLFSLLSGFPLQTD